VRVAGRIQELIQWKNILADFDRSTLAYPLAQCQNPQPGVVFHFLRPRRGRGFPSVSRVLCRAGASQTKRIINNVTFNTIRPTQGVAEFAALPNYRYNRVHQVQAQRLAPKHAYTLGGSD
jgi:hypothetical protein